MILIIKAEALGYYLEKNLPDFHVQVIFKNASEWSDWVDQAILENHWEGRLTANRSCLDKDSLSQLIYKNSGQLIGNTSDFIEWIKHCYGLELKFNGLDEIAQVNHEFYQQILSEKVK